MGGWGKELATIWTNNVAPSRPSCNEMCVYTKYLREIQYKKRQRLKLLVLGSTPEFRDWGYEENLDIYVVDKSEEYYHQVSREVRHKNLSETVFFMSWEDMKFSEKFDIIIGDLSIGNVNKSRFNDFLCNVRDSMTDDAVFLGKSFLWPEDEPIKAPKQIIEEYYASCRIHPYTFINHQLGLYCLDKEQYSIDFQKMYQEMATLLKSGVIEKTAFQNIGWNTEMKFEFFAPSQDYFASLVNKVLLFERFVHTMDVYTRVFPIYIIKKQSVEGIL